jgi:hypothetical protein
MEFLIPSTTIDLDILYRSLYFTLSTTVMYPHFYWNGCCIHNFITSSDKEAL